MPISLVPLYSSGGTNIYPVAAFERGLGVTARVPETKDPLTPNDPVSLDALKKFEELDGARYELGVRLLELEQERVRILAAAHQVDTQRQRLFEQVLVERGLQPNTPVSINDKTGEIKVLDAAVKE